MLEVRFHDNEENGGRAERGYTAYITGGGFRGVLRTVIPDKAKVMTVTDTNVAGFWLRTVGDFLTSSGFTACEAVLPAGEGIKTPERLFSLWRELERNGFRRNDFVIALGGGTVGDLAGFAAATYMRGIHFIQMPTSLLACVDSCAGGKAAVDLPSVKNGAGVFRRPDAVVCDTSFLSTLPECEFYNGMAEVVKYGLACDPGILGCAAEAADGYKALRAAMGAVSAAGLERLIARCLTAKKTYVDADEFDTGKRMALNFGHTVGHAIEILSDYGIKHGEAVAAGCCIVLRAEAALNMIAPETAARAEALVKSLGLPATSGYSAAELVSAAAADKKNGSDGYRLILIREPGDPFVMNFTAAELADFIGRGL